MSSGEVAGKSGLEMLYGIKDLCAFLDIQWKDRLWTFIEAGAPIRVIGRGNGKRYMASRQALNDWVCCRKPASRAKAG